MISRTELERLATRVAELISPQLDEVMNVAQMAALLGTTVEAVRCRCKRGRLPFYKCGRLLYFSRKEVTRYLLNDKNKIN